MTRLVLPSVERWTIPETATGPTYQEIGVSGIFVMAAIDFCTIDDGNITERYSRLFFIKLQINQSREVRIRIWRKSSTNLQQKFLLLVLNFTVSLSLLKKSLNPPSPILLRTFPGRAAFSNLKPWIPGITIESYQLDQATASIRILQN